MYENVVPHFHDQRVVHIHEVRGVPPTHLVVMNLTAGTAGALVSHLPEVVLHVARQDVVFRDANVKPQLLGLEIRLKVHVWVSFEVCHIESVRVEAVHLCEEFPRPFNGLLLEIVTKGLKIRCQYRPIAISTKRILTQLPNISKNVWLGTRRQHYYGAIEGKKGQTNW